MALLKLEQLSLERNRTVLIEKLDLQLNQGEFWAILAANGRGKTSLLHAIAGINDFTTQGNILYQTQVVFSMKRQLLAKAIGLLEQNPLFIFPAMVEKVIQLGLYPWQNDNTVFTSKLQSVETILKQFDLITLRNRVVTELSYGEQKRVAMAMLCLQDPIIYLLDEPTNHLDIQYQYLLLTYFQPSSNKLTLMVTHDLNLVERFCTNVLMIFADGTWIAGKKSDVMTSSNLTQLFRTPLNYSPTQHGKVWYLPNSFET